MYTLYKEKPPNANTDNSCKLKNNYYFVKEPKSDDKLVITENFMNSIVRTLLFIHVFGIDIKETIDDLYLKDTLTYTINGEPSKLIETASGFFVDVNVIPTILHYTFVDVYNLFDTLFGKGFSNVSLKPIKSVYEMYATKWIFYSYTSVPLRAFSREDILNVHKFYNIQDVALSPMEIFVICDKQDNKLHMQNTIKIFKR